MEVVAPASRRLFFALCREQKNCRRDAGATKHPNPPLKMVEGNQG
jgi:hypothetical protein